jgi:hypothetical protein
MEQNWVFFLKFTDELPDYYFTLAESFAAVGLKLLPISFTELTQFSDGRSKMHILCVTKSKSEYQHFITRLKPLISHVIRTNLVSLYHLSSYNKLNLGLSTTRLRNYHFSALPVNMHLLASAVLKYIQRDSEDTNRWPGGKRGTHQVAQV